MCNGYDNYRPDPRQTLHVSKIMCKNYALVLCVHSSPLIYGMNFATNAQVSQGGKRLLFSAFFFLAKLLVLGRLVFRAEYPVYRCAHGCRLTEGTG